MKKSITTKQYAVPFVLVTSLFFLWGFARSILDVLNKHFKEDPIICGEDEAKAAMIQVTTYLAYFLLAIPAGIFINKFGYRRGVVFGLSLFALGAFAFIPAESIHTLWAFLAALFIIACGLAFLETSANPYVTELGPHETATSRLNLSQTFNGLGCSLAPTIVGTYLFSGGNITLPYIIMGSLVVVVAIIFSFVKLPEITREEDPAPSAQESSEGNGLKRLMHNKAFVLGLSALLAYEIGEISINSYFISFTTQQQWLEKTTATDILSAALFIFMIGRFMGVWIMQKIDAEKVLMWCGAGCVVCMGLVLLNIQAISLPALVVNYVFEAIMFPTIFALTLRGLGNLTKTASSILMMTPVGGCAFFVVALVAQNTQNLPIPVEFLIPMAGFAVVFWFARYICLCRQK